MANKKRKKWPWIILGVLVLLVAVAAWLMRPPANTIPTASRGSLDRFPQFESKYVPARDIVVWLPEGYQTGDTCDVLYMHDGQMLFDATTTWNRQEWHGA